MKILNKYIYLIAAIIYSYLGNNNQVKLISSLIISMNLKKMEKPSFFNELSTSNQL